MSAKNVRVFEVAVQVLEDGHVYATHTESGGTIFISGDVSETTAQRWARLGECVMAAVKERERWES